MKKLLGIVFLVMLSGCGVDSLPSSSIDSKIKVQSSSPNGIQLAYSSCLFCSDFPQRASTAAQDHCQSHNANAVFMYRKKSEFYNYDYFICSAKKVSYEDKKEKAKKECADMGFRSGTNDFANCVLKLVSKDF